MVYGSENRKSLVRSPGGPIFFPRIDDSHSDRIHSSLTDVHCSNNGYVAKQTGAWKQYCAEYRLKELQESIDRCTGRRDRTKAMLKRKLNITQWLISQNC